MNVVWSEQATAQLTAIRDFFAQSSPSYARTLAENILRKTEILIDFPLFGAEVAEYADENLREVYEHPCRIMYRVHSKQVQIVAVIHAARSLPRTPPG
jgi:plasmid stabilization system protein ParE